MGPGKAREKAERLAEHIAEFPQICSGSDWEAVYRGIDLELGAALKVKFDFGFLRS